MATASLAHAMGGWQQTLDEIVPGVVVLRVNSPRAFDGQTSGYATATGFVVDAEQGLILTNRHVVTTGPVVAEAVLLDNEEIPVHAVYRDPVHDFGFFRFDPDDVDFMERQLTATSLPSLKPQDNNSFKILAVRASLVG